MNWSNWDLGLVIGILLTIINVLNFIYRYFMKAYKLKKGNDDFHDTVTKHGDKIKQLDEKVDKLVDMKEQLFEINKIQIRHNIVNTCYHAIEKGYIEQYQLQSLEDMYSMYTEILKGNSYASTMIDKTRRLEIKQD